ncbi:MAG: zinc-binding dehydrogenase [Ignavibacteriales bacterium]|nr:zinc-binding dehydrogenase [Ignavibacteriales bacterium]
MKAAVITKFGPPGVLKIQDLPMPEPGEGEVLVRVKVIGLNFADIFARLGVYPGIPDPPFVPGIEFAGIVETVGKKVRGVRKGDRVFGFSRQGAYAEVVKTRADYLTRIPKKMTFHQAAAFSVASFSAYHGLVTLANIKRNEKLLLHAAAGGVGTMAIQIARHLGAEIFATAGSASKLEVARKLGADHLVNYRAEDFADVIRRESNGYGVDVVLDSVGGSVFRKGWNLLAPMGRYVLFGFAAMTGKRSISKVKMLMESARVAVIFPPSLVSRNVSLIGFNLYFLAHKVELFKRVAKVLIRWYEKGIIKTQIGSVYRFDQIASAHEFLQSRKSVGKVVVEL